MGAEYRINYLEDSAAWQTFVSQLDRFARFTSERRICGHVFLHTRLSALGDRHPYKDIYQQVAEAARARGLSVTESLPYHEGFPATRLWVGLYDSHPNIEGHRILAKALQKGLRRDVPRECWDVDLSGWPKLSPIPKKPRARARHTRDQST